jgi:transcriptional regulator with XRE-family HTH domain
MDFGENLRTVRAEKNLSQADFAALVRMSTDAVSRIERGLVNPSPQQLVVFAVALEVSSDKLLGLADPQDAEGESDAALADLRRLMRTARQLGSRELNLTAQLAEALLVSQTAKGAKP